MSSNLLWPQFPVSSIEMGQSEPNLKGVDSAIPEFQMGEMNCESSYPESQKPSMEPISEDVNSPIPEFQMGEMNCVSSHPESQLLSMEPVPDNPGLCSLPMTYLQMGHIANGNGNLGSHDFLMPSNQLGDVGLLHKNVGSHQLLTSIKRKTSEPMSDSPMTHQLTMLNKRAAHMENRPWLQQAPAANIRVAQVESLNSAPVSPRLPAANKKMVKMQSAESMHNAPRSPHLPASNKKMVKMESFSGRSGFPKSSSQKNQTLQTQPSFKRQNESSESLRSKMRESLAAALALVNEQQDKSVDSGKKSHSGAGGIQGTTQENSQPDADPVNLESKEIKENFPFGETCSIGKSNDGDGVGQRVLADATAKASTLTSICDVNDFQPFEGVSFSDNLFVKDELLQGNGLSWVLDSEMEMAEINIQPAEEQQLIDKEMIGCQEEQAVQSPEELAFRIEAELFKLFGGVNKDYKIKGRSLLFNLKDRNNPKLRERVMSGEIPPEQLCSMTADELASKELSEWRTAKKNEFDQRVVLPDSEVDIRRLVKKTHKGEVEVEQYDSDVVDVPVGATSHTESQPRSKETELSTPSKPDKPKEEVNSPGEKSTTEEKGTFTIPSTEAGDFMQGLMVDDGLKDLPPIVSLDEFMESLDMEPPFEIIPGKSTPNSDKDGSETGSESKSSVLSPKNTGDTSLQKPDEIDTTDSKSGPDLKTSGSKGLIKTENHALMKASDSADTKPHADVKSSGSPEKSASRLPSTPKGERIWDGSLQLNLSPMASVIAIYKSGEKTSAKEWPSCLDIKGRVKLEAFEKFLQELPQSRSRAVMVAHFVPKEGSSDTECAILREVAEAYVTDERVGFCEPCSGVEIYFCPPHNKTVDMLSKIIQKERIDALNTIDNGLVGVIVWRKLTSPKSSSHHKHSSKKQHYSSSTSRRQHDRNTDTNFPSKPAQPRASPSTSTRPVHDDDDDVPPGFGPVASRDEDDLPEFNFSAQRPSRGLGMAPPLYPKSHTPSRPVDQMRELIQKYGQNDSSTYQVSAVAVQPWNDDDDDDIPEWQPNVPTQPRTPYHRPAANSYQQPMLRPNLANQPHIGLAQQQQQQQHLQSLPPTVNVASNLQNPNPSWQWAPPAQGGAGMYASNQSCQPEAGRFYGEPDRGGAAAVAPPGIAWRGQNAPKSRGF